MASDDQTDDDREQPKRADGHDRKRDGDQQFDGDDYRSPINVDGLPHVLLVWPAACKQL